MRDKNDYDYEKVTNTNIIVPVIFPSLAHSNPIKCVFRIYNVYMFNDQHSHELNGFKSLTGFINPVFLILRQQAQYNDADAWIRSNLLCEFSDRGK